MIDFVSQDIFLYELLVKIYNDYTLNQDFGTAISWPTELVLYPIKKYGHTQHMGIDKRKHARFNPQGLTANIILVPSPFDKEIALQGTVIDMSYSGIKIKLNSAMPSGIVESKIKINLTIPESGIPITIQGIIKHLNEQSECGLYYATNNPEHEVDELMFECIKCARIPTQLQIVNF